MGFKRRIVGVKVLLHKRKIDEKKVLYEVVKYKRRQKYETSFYVNTLNV